eukprot:746638-Hanusia_phi.AAC.5
MGIPRSVSRSKLLSQAIKVQDTVPGLWTYLDWIRSGISVVYYHPTSVMQAILAGQILEAASLLKTLYLEIKTQSLSTVPSAQNLSLDSLTPATRESDSDFERDVDTVASTLKGIEERKGRKSAEAFKDANLESVKKLAVLKVSNATKTLALAKLIVKEPVLLQLLEDEGLDTWDEGKGAFRSPPDFDAIKGKIEQIELLLSSKTCETVEEDQNGNGEDDQSATHGANHKEESVITAAEVKELLRCVIS